MRTCVHGASQGMLMSCRCSPLHVILRACTKLHETSVQGDLHHTAVPVLQHDAEDDFAQATGTSTHNALSQSVPCLEV